MEFFGTLTTFETLMIGLAAGMVIQFILYFIFDFLGGKE